MAAESEPGKALRAHDKQHPMSAGQGLSGSGQGYCCRQSASSCIISCLKALQLPVLPCLGPAAAHVSCIDKQSS